MEIKICGITNLNDALCASDSGADALGFIFYRKSSRYIEPEAAADIISRLPRKLCKVGVFVNHDAREVEDIFYFCDLDMIQLHGDETLEYCCQFPEIPIIKAVQVTAESDLQALREYPVRAILADSRREGKYGGTGEIFNWNLAVGIKEMHPLIVAGGLNVSNIGKAIETVFPDAVDVNSGVEDAPGKKNPEKVKNMIGLIRKLGRDHIMRTAGRNIRVFSETLQETL